MCVCVSVSVCVCICVYVCLCLHESWQSKGGCRTLWDLEIELRLLGLAASVFTP